MQHSTDPEEILNQPEVLEKLAAVEHLRWAHWQRYVHSNCHELEDGSLVIPADLVQRWERQIATPYSELSDDECSSDLDQVKLYLPTVIAALQQGK